jgi:hypothetical protein
VVACSTPAVAALYSALGFEIDPVEAGADPEPERPWDVLLRLAAGDESWRSLAHEADGEDIVLSLGDAMDFLTRKDYTDNWLSETQEQFCGLEFADWKSLLTDVGFELDPASHTTRNDWIVEHRLVPVATLSTPAGEPVEWPVTHILFTARRPLNT